MGNFTFRPTKIEGVWIVEPRIFGDERGYFMETYHFNEFAKAGLNMPFVQDNQSMSTKGVLRGLHLQKTKPQGKLVRALFGEVFDVCVDLRPHSPTYLKHESVVLSGENKKMFYIPEGFAHGYLTLSDTAVFAYKCTDFYDPSDEAGILWNSIGINWPEVGKEYILSHKDQSWPSAKDFK